MALSDVVIRESEIHGKGVFAGREFDDEEIIFKWDTSVGLTLEKINELPEEARKYVTSIGEGIYLLLQPPERYVNHSCSPNLEVKDYCDVAIRDVKEGEELTIDYSKEGIPNLNLNCNCESSNCRGIIRSD